MTIASQTYTEQDVEAFSDQTLRTYLSFWAGDGVLHTGHLAGPDDEDYRTIAIADGESGRGMIVARKPADAAGVAR